MQEILGARRKQELRSMCPFGCGRYAFSGKLEVVDGIFRIARRIFDGAAREADNGG